MSLVKRVGDVEENFTPKEAVICWMREAHEFDSLLTYGRWLLDQPEDVYPLIRMPRQVVAAVRRKNKGTPDMRLREEFYRVQRDLLFLYHLHQQVNLQALQQEEALHLRMELLNEKLRSLIYHVAVVDGRRLEGLKLPDEWGQRRAGAGGRRAWRRSSWRRRWRPGRPRRCCSGGRSSPLRRRSA